MYFAINLTENIIYCHTVNEILIILMILMILNIGLSRLLSPVRNVSINNSRGL